MSHTMRSERLIVKAYVPWKRNLFIIFILLFLMTSLSVAYVLGEKTAGFDRLESIHLQSSLRNEITNLKNTNGELIDQVALLERTQQVDTKAYRQVDKTLRVQQNEILELREEISFYRGIISPADGSAGMRVQTLDVTKTSEKNGYHYVLVLTQVLKNDRVVRGTVQLEFLGMKNAKAHSVKLASISVQKLKQYNYKFRYFEKFEGDVVVPSGFAVRTVKVLIKPRKSKRITRSFDWPQMNSGS